MSDGDRWVAFLGAGASRGAPSFLPTWSEFNTLVLKELCDRLAEFSRNRQPTEQILEALRHRRDTTQFFSPDFQAQLMEEEVGEAYFRVWQSLDGAEFGPIHAGLAELASHGRLAAIITTNFDRLIENALTARGQAFEVFHDAASYDRLADSLLWRTSQILPVIKIHGSIEDSASLVDTLRQRVMGRPASLNTGISSLLREFCWFFIGFSGADFDYDREYLGIRAAAADARGFEFLERPGIPIRASVLDLAGVYGQEKATTINEDARAWLTRRFGVRIDTGSPDCSAMDEARVFERVRSGVREWSQSIGFMGVVNILCAMLTSAGLDVVAFRLMRKTWRSYRAPEDTRNRSYPRYCLNYGLALLDSGLISNPVALSDGMDNLTEWKRHADQNAVEFFLRAYREGSMLTAGARSTEGMALRGQIGKALNLAAAVVQETDARGSLLDGCDVAIACCTLYDIVQSFQGAISHLRPCEASARRLGDEPRRAILCANLGRFHTYAGEFAEADQALLEAETIIARLDLRGAGMTATAARALWRVDSNTDVDRGKRELLDLDRAVVAQQAAPLVTTIDALDPLKPSTSITIKRPIRCRVLLDLLWAAMIARDGDVMTHSLDALDELVPEHFPGYCPHYYLGYARCELAFRSRHEHEMAVELIGRARLVGEQSENPWAVLAADQLESIARGSQ